CYLFLLPHLTPISTLFPYTTLFRSSCVIFGYSTWAPCASNGGNATFCATQSRWPSTSGSEEAAAMAFARFGNPYPCARETINPLDRKSTRLNSSHVSISYAVFCLKK